MNFRAASSRSADQSKSSNGDETVSRTFNVHRFDPHPRRKILIIQGEISITVTSSLCPVVLAEDKREFKKLVSLDGLQKDSDREQVADAILRECPFIDPELRIHLVVTIEFIKNRKYDDNGLVITPTSSAVENLGKSNKSASSTPTDFPDYLLESEALVSSQASEMELNEKVDVVNMESYVELLYEEDFNEKIRGARSIAKLGKIPENLTVIAFHETAMNAMFRTLREDYRKSMDLTTHIMSLSLSFAQFSDFHPILLTNKICSVTFDVIEFELQRYERWRLEVDRRQDIVDNKSEFPGSAGSYQKAKNDFEKMRQRFTEITRKQDHLLALSFDVILYLSENQALQPEIFSRGVVPMLVDTLARKNIDLLKVVLTYLKNLSIFHVCKSQMAQLYITEKIAQLLDANIPNEIVSCCLNLLFNLSFDTKLRHKMVMFGLLPKLAYYLEDSVLETVTRKIIYVMSMDRKVRPKFGALVQILPILIRKLNENREESVKNSLDVAGILVNLALNKKCASALCENNGLVEFLQQAFESEDEIVMKIVRNVSEHSSNKELFAPFVCDLARAIRDATSEEFIIECIGTLANLDLPNIDFCKLLEEFNLVQWILSILGKYIESFSGSEQQSVKSNNKNAMTEISNTSDLVMEVVILTGTCCSDSECADLLIEEGVLENLIKILLSTEDVEVKSQVLYVFYKMCAHSGSKQHIQENTIVPKVVLELLQNDDDQIQQLCEGIMSQFGENDEVWMDKLREKRFRYYNEAWIEMTDRSLTNSDGESDDDPFGLTYGNTREKVVIELPSSASETLISEDESGEEHSDLEVDEEHTSRDKEGRTSHQIGGNIFNQFKAQYEHEMRAKEQLQEDQDGEFSDEDNNEDGEMTLVRDRNTRAKSARRAKR